MQAAVFLTLTCACAWLGCYGLGVLSLHMRQLNNNEHYIDGGAVGIIGSTAPVSMQWCFMTGNTACSGGSIALRDGAMLALRNSQINSSLCATDGAGLLMTEGATLDGSNLVVQSSVSLQNGRGGGLHATESGGIAIRNSYWHDTTARQGGALYLKGIGGSGSVLAWLEDVRAQDLGATLGGFAFVDAAALRVVNVHGAGISGGAMLVQNQANLNCTSTVFQDCSGAALDITIDGVTYPGSGKA